MKVYEAEKYIDLIEQNIEELKQFPSYSEEDDNTLTGAIVFLGDYKHILEDAIKHAEIKLI